MLLCVTIVRCCVSFRMSWAVVVYNYCHLFLDFDYYLLCECLLFMLCVSSLIFYGHYHLIIVFYIPQQWGICFLTIKRSHYTLPGITTSYNLRLLCKPPSFWQFKMQQVKFKHLCSFALLFLHRMWYILFIFRDLNNFYPISVSWENHGL